MGMKLTPPHLSGSLQERQEQTRRFLCQLIEQLEHTLEDTDPPHAFNLTLSNGVSPSNFGLGRCGGTGCCLRTDKKHVYISFNCSLYYEGKPVTINATPIPEGLRPRRDVYAVCSLETAEGRAIAQIVATSAGYIAIDWIQTLPSTEQTASATVKWIDANIDYWI